jgi:hypothetical protein
MAILYVLQCWEQMNKRCTSDFMRLSGLYRQNKRKHGFHDVVIRKAMLFVDLCQDSNKGLEFNDILTLFYVFK